MTRNSNDGPTDPEKFDSNPASTSNPMYESTFTGASKNSININNATSQRSEPTNEAENPDALGYSQEKGKKNTNDPIDQAVAFLKKHKLEPAQKRLEELEKKDGQIPKDFEHTYAQFKQAFDKIKASWAVKNAEREIHRVQNKDAPDHRGHLEDVLSKMNEQKWIDMQRKQNEAGSWNVTNNVIKPLGYGLLNMLTAGLVDWERLRNRIQLGDKLKSKFPEEQSFKPNTGAPTSSANENAEKNEAKQTQGNAPVNPSPKF